MIVNLVYNPLIPFTKERAVLPAVITRDGKLAASECDEDLCLPGVYIFPIPLEQCQLNTGCCCKNESLLLQFSMLSWHLHCGGKQLSSLVQQLVQQQGASSQPLLAPSRPAAGCLLPAACRWMCSRRGAEHGRKPGDIKVWSV